MKQGSAPILEQGIISLVSHTKVVSELGCKMWYVRVASRFAAEHFSSDLLTESWNPVQDEAALCSYR